MPVKKVTKVPVSSYDALSDEVKALMDRAVRVSRKNYWCDRFDEAAPEIFNVPRADVVDSDGFSCRGYNRLGFNKEGWNREGFNTEGYNERGYNAKGYNKDGFDRYGMNAEGFDVKGRDKYRFDSDGYDQEGYDYTGSRRRTNREWYEAQAAKPDADFKYDSNLRTRPVPRKTAAKKATPAAADVTPVKAATVRRRAY